MKKLINNPTIGSDFELFLMDKTTKEIVSAEGLIQGTKYQPFIFDKASPFFAISLDNVLAEACIPPTNSKDLFREYIAKSRGYIESILPAHLCTVAKPAAILDEKWLQTENAQTFGCEPDYNVWTREMNQPPKAEEKRLRSAGGHIHVGYKNPEMVTSEFLVKALDLFIGVPSVLQEPDNERKLLYGKAGSFRPKDYGIEYRTLSNYILENEKLTDWAFDATMSAISFVNEGNGNDLDEMGEYIQIAINNNDKTVAQTLINHFNLNLV